MHWLITWKIDCKNEWLPIIPMVLYKLNPLIFVTIVVCRKTVKPFEYLLVRQMKNL
jgi:hypothetical protein